MASTADTTEMLSKIRQEVLRWETARPGSREENEAAEAATRLMSELDAALCDGAELPDPWHLAQVAEAAERSTRKDHTRRKQSAT